MKKFLSILLAAVCMFGVLGCGNKPSTPPENESGGQQPGGQQPGDNTGNTGGEQEQPDNGLKTFDASNGLKLLMIGNSHSEDAKQYFIEIAKNLGIKNIVVGELHIGGTSLQDHKKNAEENNAVYYYRKSGAGGWTETYGHTLDEGIADEDWDIVDLHQASYMTGLDLYMTDPAADATVQYLIDFVKARCTNPNVQLSFMMTWGYHDAFSSKEFEFYDCNHSVQYRSMVKCSRALVEKHDEFSYYVPVGTAVENAYYTSLNDQKDYANSLLYRDQVHLNFVQGRYLAGLTYICMLTGKNPDDLTWKPVGVTDAQDALIKKCVKAAIANPYAYTQIEE